MQSLLQWKNNDITYSDIVLVALCIQHVMRMRHLWPLRLYYILPYYLINSTMCVKKIIDTKCDLIFPTNFVSNISHPKKN